MGAGELRGRQSLQSIWHNELTLRMALDAAAENAARMAACRSSIGEPQVKPPRATSAGAGLTNGLSASFSGSHCL